MSISDIWQKDLNLNSLNFIRKCVSNFITQYGDILTVCKKENDSLRERERERERERDCHLKEHSSSAISVIFLERMH